MIPITLSDSTIINVENESSQNNFVIRTNNFSQLDEWKNVITEENINGAVMEGNILSDLIFNTINVTLESDCIRADFIFREKTENEILTDRLSEAEEAINFLLMGGE